MVAGTYATRRVQHSMKNGFPKGSNGFASHRRELNTELEEDLEETPLLIAVMTYKNLARVRALPHVKLKPRFIFPTRLKFTPFLTT